MKLTIILLLACFFQVSATVSAQNSKYNFDIKGKQVEEVLREIEETSDVHFFYQRDQIDLDRKVNLKVSDSTIEEILEKLFNGNDIVYEFKENNLILLRSDVGSSNGSVQQGSTKGKVVDDGGLPLPGVTVMVKGTSKGTITNPDGEYSLASLSSDDVLVFSFIGMVTQEYTVGNQTMLNVTLAPSLQDIDEVIVVGYGTVKKVNLTGAVDQVSSVELENRPIKDIGQGLKGVVPNLNIEFSSGAPDAKASFNIRGFSGIDDDGDPVKGSPLVLVDGVPQDINQVNPEDVESITVLKDAASAAIYGSRAPYGVILVTTKSGKEGKMNINVSSNISFSEVVGLPENVNSYEFALGWNDAHMNARKNPYYGDETLQVLKDVVDGKVSDASRIDAGAGRWGAYGDFQLGNSEWQDLAYRRWQVNQKHTVSFSGGIEDGKLNYYASMGWNQNQGIMNEMLKDTYDRYNTVLKLTSKVNDWLSVTLNNRYSRRVIDRPKYGAGDYYFAELVGGRTWPVVPWQNPDGNFSYSNPIWRASEAGNVNEYINDYWTTASFTLTPMKGLNVKGSYTWNSHSRDYTRPYFNITPITDWTDEAGTNWYHEWKYQNHPNSLSKAMNMDTYHQVDLFATYEFKLGEGHNFTLLGGYQEELKKFHELSGSKKQLITEDIPSISTAIGDNPSLDDKLAHWSTRGYFTRFNYNYKEKVLFEFNGRYDASSRFPKDTRWAFFPSFSAGYNIAKEDFWPVSEISMFKVRGSYGELGNQNTAGYYPYLPTMRINAKTQNVLGGSRVPSVEIPGLVSPDITWEKPRTIDFGLDVVALNNRLSFTYDWYQRTVYDQIGKSEQLPEVLGTSVPRKNDAVTETRGWELSASWKDQTSFAGKPLNWGARVVVSDYVGYVVEFENQTGSWSGTWTKGERFGDIYGYEVEKVAQSSADFTNATSHHRFYSDYWYPGDLVYKDLDGNGMVEGGTSSWYNKGDLKVLGNTSPRYTYGIVLSGDWNGFDLRMNFEGVGKQDRWFNGLYNRGITGSIWWSTVMKHSLDYWRPDNTDAWYPRPYMSGQSGSKFKTNSRHITNSAYLRFKTVQLGYTLPASLIQKLALKKLRVYATVENVGLLINKSRVKIDPLLINNSNGRTYPPQRTFSLGLNLTF